MSQLLAATQTPTVVDTSARGRFMQRAGLLYGAIFALGFACAFWGLDALALQQASVYLWWGKFAIGLVLVLPLCMLAGWLSTRIGQSAISIALWIITVALIALIASHMPFDGPSWLASLNDPYPNAQAMYPFSVSSATVTGLCVLIGAGIGLFIGLLSLLLIDRAWERSTRSNRLSLRSILLLGLNLIPIVILAPIMDNYIDAPLRTAFVDVHSAFDLALDPKVNLAAVRLPFLQSLRGQLSSNYTLLWVSSSADQQMNTVDVQFDNGLLLRCGYNFGMVGVCAPLDRDLHEWMTELMTAGHLTCAGCSVQTDRATRRWLAAVLPTYDSAKVQSVQMLQDQGGWIYERATFDSGRKIDCRFSGASPIVVDLCIEAKN